MAVAETWRWDEQAFLRAYESGVFGDQRVELVEGAVWPVVIGDWHGQVVGNVTGMLHAVSRSWRVTSSTLPSSGSLPDPDVWVLRRGATAMERVAVQLSRWAPEDVGLVVEVADASLDRDLLVKARLYGRTGYPAYWVVHRDGIEALTEPYEGGYRLRRSVPADGAVEVPYLAGVTLAVAELLDAD